MSKSIVVVGAGLSGFSAAARLMENGFTDLTILEAEDRFGGRIHSVDYLDGKIDLGGQWCHGQGKNIIYESAHETFDFGITPFASVPVTFLLSDGSLPDQRMCQKLSDLAFSLVDNDDGDMGDFEGSLGDYVTKKMDEAVETSEFEDIDPALVAMVKDNVHRQINGYFASPSWHNISAKLNAQYDETEGIQHLTWKRQGFVTYFNYITVNGAGVEILKKYNVCVSFLI
jgi:spermine oxidase